MGGGSVAISVPFLVKGTGVMGEIRYSASFTPSGMASTSYRVGYAKKIVTSEEFYSNLGNSDDPALAWMAFTTLCWLWDFGVVTLTQQIRKICGVKNASDESNE